MTSAFDETGAPVDETSTDEVSADETAADTDSVDEAAVEADASDTDQDDTDQAETDETPAEDEAEQATDPLQEFRDRLWSQPGDWYVIHTYAGMEKRVQQNLENRKVALNAEDYIHEIVVPTEEVAEIKNGQRKLVRRTVLPGYVLVRMDLTDDSWGVVRHTPSVTGFVGNTHQPVPLSLSEVEKMLAPAVEAEAAAEATATAEPQQPAQARVEFSDFAPGDSVLVIDGPFATLHATVTEINIDGQKVKGLVEIFGRETSVELPFDYIQKV
ncbi:transcription termination/antitermination protein NusG [Aeromicrobium duanguangcaii]|uniref:Transcription termination/antitermination protein NusG n=1 Tax=Aeromicrobium duanguangcaii TaxID=2968086 RepID=A0ABY5KGR9_9ACTN|nr:transcription termination/antitermination protein NusG [Aeromicrobium duanguangcaii]MCD9153979.1 transcription termination/antitermination protein NusG [Aeromicrobium duanguangcaii]UUI68943.1 transcription termination/antitermination protein NusG [Aeromicrobium duanguangcaii]